MCGGSAWLVEGWRPWGDLTRDFGLAELAEPDADAALSRRKDKEQRQGRVSRRSV
jgi:hypothetical protein